MRGSLLIALELAVPWWANAQSSSRGTKKSFEFRGHVMGDPLRGIAECSPEDTDCFSISDRIGEARVDIAYNLVADRFEGWFLQLEPDQFEHVRDAFVAKWENRCRSSHPSSKLVVA